MYQIKSVPDDFVVEEITKITKSAETAKIKWKMKMEKLGRKKRKTNVYTVFLLTKRNIDIFKAILLISKKCGVNPKDFGYAGTKDKRAVTKQMISVPGSVAEKLRRINMTGLEITNIFESQKPIKLGDLAGNRFHIMIRNIDPKDKDKVEKNIRHIKNKGFLNIFGEQRFGTPRQVNHIIGRHIIKGDFKKAVIDFLTLTGGESDDATQARIKLKREMNFKKAVSYFPGGLKYERVILEYLSKNPDDYKDALARLPKMLSRMFIHAYQSWVWNKAAEKIRKDVIIPLIGSKTHFEDYPESGKVIKGIMREEGIALSDFVIRNMMFLSTRGDERRTFIFPRNIRTEFGEDELNPGKMKLAVDFELPKGSYATTLINDIMKS